MGKAKDLSEMRFGKLTAVSIIGKDDHGENLWECVCDCGNTKIAKTRVLTSGHVKSCGCYYKKDLVGQRFGRLTVLSENGRDKIKNVLWNCRCDCGNSVVVRSSMLMSGRSKSCGCFRKETQSELNKTHGLTGTRLYRIWTDMKTRCCNEDNVNYKRYGAKGITICQEWLDDFMNFYKWAMANGYRDDLTLDRKDNDKGYSPDNCRWATYKEQANNKTNNRIIEHNGESHTIAEWAEMHKMNPHTLRDRIELGITEEELFEKRDRRFKKFPTDDEVEV